MKKVMVIGKGLDPLRAFLIQHFQKDNVHFQKNQKHEIATEDVIYYFFEGIQGRNIDRFVRKYKKMDHIFEKDPIIQKYSVLADAEFKEKIYTLIEQDLNRIKKVKHGNEKKLLTIHPLYSVEEVFTLSGANVNKITIFNQEFNEKIHYKTEQEANDKLIKQAEEKIKFFENEIKKQKNFISKLKSN